MIRENLEAIRKELPQGVELVAVSKFNPLENVLAAYDAGQRVFAESRPQELLAKVRALEGDGTHGDIVWHFIGHLQTNKLKMVLPYVELVQSIDTVHLLAEVEKWAAQNDRKVSVLLELHLGAEETKQGFAEEEIMDVLFNAGKYPHVLFRGLMGMASHTDDEAAVEADFERIDSFMAYLKDLFPEYSAFDQLSIGMSADWKIAVRHGATMVRIGSSVFHDN